jgi:dipeptidyl aminopeptidase/acylaminoacyl peptidase
MALGTSALLSLALTSDQHPITFDEFSAVGAVSEPQISPDGHTVLYTVTTADLSTNKRMSVTWHVASSGGSARRFPDDTTKATEARWSPDGRRVAYIAGGQLWVASAEGAARNQITKLTGEATGPKWSPDGAKIAFTSRVYPTCMDDACNAKTAKATDASPVKAHVADHLLYRHWNAWDDGTRAHLFVISMSTRSR